MSKNIVYADRVKQYTDAFLVGAQQNMGLVESPNRLLGHHVRRTWLGKETSTWAETVTVSKLVAKSIDAVYLRYSNLRARHADSDVLPQLEKGLEELYSSARTVGADMIATADIIVMAARLCAVADMALERELALHMLDSDSLSRTADRLYRDLETLEQIEKGENKQAWEAPYDL